jgi:iron(III) transport system substrate-binding protein
MRSEPAMHQRSARDRYSRRFVLRGLLFGSAVTVLAACQQSSPTSPAGTAAPAPPTAQSAPAKPAAAGATSTSTGSQFEALLEGAKKEGQVIWSGAVPQNATLQKAAQQFNTTFGTSIQVQGLPVPARDLPARLATEARSNTSSVDAAWGTATNLSQLDTAGLLDAYPWVQTFGDKLPQLKTGVERMEEFFAGGKGLDWFHLTYCLVFNTGAIKREELPKTWDELADPKWKSQFAFSSIGSPFGILGISRGAQPAIETVKKIQANAPRLGRGSPEIVELIITGEVPFGVADTASAEARKRAGAPIDWALLDAIPFTRTAVYVPKFAPHPQAARLFAAWMSHDGLLLLEKEEGWGQTWPDSGFELAKAAANQKATLVYSKNLEQIRQEDDLNGQLAKVLTQ